MEIANNNNNNKMNNAIALKQLLADANKYFTDTNLDVPGIQWFEHLNIQVGSKVITETFYRDILGFTSDPSPSFHYNLGAQQFHFMLGKDDNNAHIIQGSIGLSVPSLKQVLKACHEVGNRTLSSSTKFQILSENDRMVTLIGPYGNTFHIYQAGYDENKDQVAFNNSKSITFMEKKHMKWDNAMDIQGKPGIKFLEFQCKNAEDIANFYQTYFGCNIYFGNSNDDEVNNNNNHAVVQVGPNIYFIFTSNANLTTEMMKLQEGVHVAVYISQFKNSYDMLKKDNIIWTNPRFVRLDKCDTWEDAKAGRQYRFKDFIDSKTNNKIFELEHETRSIRHYQYLKDVAYVPFMMGTNDSAGEDMMKKTASLL